MTFTRTIWRISSDDLSSESPSHDTMDTSTNSSSSNPSKNTTNTSIISFFASSSVLNIRSSPSIENELLPQCIMVIIGGHTFEGRDDMTLLQGQTIITVKNLQYESPLRNKTLLCLQLMCIIVGGDSTGGKQQAKYLFYSKVGNKSKHHLLITLECFFVTT